MRIVVSGYGTIGQLLTKKIDESSDLTLSNIIDHEGRSGVLSPSLLEETPDCMIDFSHPAALAELIHYAVTHQVPLVIATTGYSEEELARIENASKLIPILHTSNTSYGIQVVLETVKKLKNLLPEADIEIVEHHHRNKVDAPSGTANMIAEAIKDHKILVYGRTNKKKRLDNEIGIHSIRGGSVSGYHEVSFFLQGEQITLSHRAESKDVFVEGAIKAAQFIVKQQPGYYQMQDVIKE